MRKNRLVRRKRIVLRAGRKVDVGIYVECTRTNDQNHDGGADGKKPIVLPVSATADHDHFGGSILRTSAHSLHRAEMAFDGCDAQYIRQKRLLRR